MHSYLVRGLSAGLLVCLISHAQRLRDLQGSGSECQSEMLLPPATLLIAS
jgi:hypothetical protein